MATHIFPDRAFLVQIAHARASVIVNWRRASRQTRSVHLMCIWDDGQRAQNPGQRLCARTRTRGCVWMTNATSCGVCQSGRTSLWSLKLVRRQVFGWDAVRQPPDKKQSNRTIVWVTFINRYFCIFAMNQIFKIFLIIKLLQNFKHFLSQPKFCK